MNRTKSVSAFSEPTSGQKPRVDTIGTDGLLIAFGDHLSEPANRAALAFRDALEEASLSCMRETSNTLASTYLRFDPNQQSHSEIIHTVRQLLSQQDWYAAPLPNARRLWHIPTVFGTEVAPQLAEAAAEAGMSADEAIETISRTQVRVQTIGFAPGQPYLGELPPQWNIPRQTALTEAVPVGALTVAIRQLVLFSVASPTGWRHIGQTAFQAFRPDADVPVVLRPGDEVLFLPVPADALAGLKAQGPDGGAMFKVLP